MQVAGIEGEHIILLLEDHQMVEPVFLELVNSLLCAGDVPGLYTSEELEPILSPLREQAMQEEFRGPLYAYFAHRVMKYLHVVLIMDCTASSFTAHCEANPALYKSSSFQWMDSWSKESMLKGSYHHAKPSCFIFEYSSNGRTLDRKVLLSLHTATRVSLKFCTDRACRILIDAQSCHKVVFIVYLNLP